MEALPVLNKEVIKEYGLELDPSNQKNESLKLHVESAEKSFAAQDYKKASREFGKILKKRASRAQLAYFAFRLGQCAVEIQSKSGVNPKQARPGTDDPIRFFHLAYVLDPFQREVVYGLAKMHTLASRYEEAGYLLDVWDNLVKEATDKVHQEFVLSKEFDHVKWPLIQIEVACKRTVPNLDKAELFWKQLGEELTVEKKKEWRNFIDKAKTTAPTPPPVSTPTPTPTPTPSSSSSSFSSSAPWMKPKEEQVVTPLAVSTPTQAPVPVVRKKLEFRLRFLGHETDNKGMMKNMSKMAQTVTEQGCYWETDRCKLIWEPDSQIPHDIDVIVNFPKEKHDLDLRKIIYLDMEPEGNRYWFPEIWQRLHRGAFRAYLPRNNLEWHIPQTYRELINMSCPSRKQKKLVILVSGEERLEGHRNRLDLVAYLDSHWPDSEFQLDIFGKSNPRQFKHYRGSLSPAEKHKAFQDYQYVVAIENTTGPKNTNYFTEKFADGVLWFCLLFYLGCSRMDLWFEKECAVFLEDIKDHAGILNCILDGMRQDLYYKRLPAIERTRYHLLNHVQMFPTLERLVMNHFAAVTSDSSLLPKTLVINLDRRSDRWKKFETQIKFIEETNQSTTKMPYERFSATDYKNVTAWSQEWEDLFRIEHPFFPKRYFGPHGYNAPVVATAHSWYRAMTRIAQDDSLQDLDSVLYVEDDVIFTPGFLSKLNTLMRTLVADTRWGIVYLGNTDMQTQPYDELVYEGIERLRAPPGQRRLNGAGAFCWLCRKSAAQKFLQLAKTQRIQQPVDHFMIDCFDSIVAYMCKPAIATSPVYNPQTGHTDTDIQNRPETFQDLRKTWLSGTNQK